MKKIVIIIFIIAIRLNSITELDSLRTALLHSSSVDSIEIFTENEKGTTITITLPVKKARSNSEEQ